MYSRFRSIVLIALLLNALAPAPSAARAEDAIVETADDAGIPVPQPRRRWYDPRRAFDRLRRGVESFRPPEIVEMLWALAHGSGMGPGEGWFHDGQTRYGWAWLAERVDLDDDGQIDRDEFFGPAEWFERLDRNDDGQIKADDFDWSDHSEFVRQSQQARQVFRRIDPDSNGRISRAEWEAFFENAAHGSDEITPEDLRAAFNPPAPPGASDDGPSPLTILKGLWDGELGSFHEGPAVGGRAPDFEMPTFDGRGRLRLSELYRRKPVVVIFGSFT
ncbi:MAG TPA: EF-hand domain-containing protein [Pirellulales bacterium]|nr:EF-hand domain-containing protein [Pirellulales bacterium]